MKRTTGDGTLSARSEDAASDQLEYVADLLAELNVIATGLGCETLAALLTLSKAEAMRQIQGMKAQLRPHG